VTDEEYRPPDCEICSRPAEPVYAIVRVRESVEHQVSIGEVSKRTGSDRVALMEMDLCELCADAHPFWDRILKVYLPTREVTC
jgi:hypothetical protein